MQILDLPLVVLLSLPCRPVAYIHFSLLSTPQRTDFCFG